MSRDYTKKRDFSNTPEPEAVASKELV